MAWGESKTWLAGADNQALYQDLLDDAATASERNAKRRKIIKPDEMPWEMAPQGLLKHLINEAMNTRMETVDAEECLYVVEGRGCDLHQDCDCRDHRRLPLDPASTTSSRSRMRRNTTRAWGIVPGPNRD